MAESASLRYLLSYEVWHEPSHTRRSANQTFDSPEELEAYAAERGYPHAMVFEYTPSPTGVSVLNRPMTLAEWRVRRDLAARGLKGNPP